MIVINCDNPSEIEQAKEALNTSCFGLIIMQEAEEWSLIRDSLEYASDYMTDDLKKKYLLQYWKKLL